MGVCTTALSCIYTTYTEANTNSWVIIILFQKMTEVKKTWQKCKG